MTGGWLTNGNGVALAMFGSSCLILDTEKYCKLSAAKCLGCSPPGVELGRG